MIKPYGLSQPPTLVCGIQTLPAFCHKERFLSYKKKRGKKKKKKGGYVCVQIFKNKPSNLLQSSHKVFLPGFVEKKIKKHMLIQRGEKKRVLQQKKPPKNKHPLVSKGAQIMGFVGAPACCGCSSPGGGWASCTLGRFPFM